MRRRCLSRRRRAVRPAMASLEVVLSIAVMVPIAAAMLFLGVKVCTTLYQAIGTLVGWPFL